MNSVDLWNTCNGDTRLEICLCLGWPEQYADGEASLEWLTQEQYDHLAGYEQAGESYDEMVQRVWPETIMDEYEGDDY